MAPVKGLFRLCKFASNFQGAQDKLPGKLKARAIIPTRGCWILLRKLSCSVCSTSIEGGGSFVLERLSTLSQPLFTLQRISSSYLVLGTIYTNTYGQNHP